MGKEERLKVCPFCGGKAKVLNFIENEWIVCCIECGGSYEKWCETKKEAVKQWNKRKPVEKIVDQLEQMKLSDKKWCEKTSIKKCRKYVDCKSCMIDMAIKIVKGSMNNI